MVYSRYPRYSSLFDDNMPLIAPIYKSAHNPVQITKEITSKIKYDIRLLLQMNFLMIYSIILVFIYAVFHQSFR